MMTRAEHVRWCKQRARDEYAYYKAQGDLEAARRNGVVSMMSDLGKHPDTQALVQTAFVVGMTVVDEHSWRRFVDGFTE